VPLGKINHYLCEKICGCCVRQIHYALNDLRYAMRTVGHMKPGNDA